jgi:hypothetical protein
MGTLSILVDILTIVVDLVLLVFIVRRRKK